MKKYNITLLKDWIGLHEGEAVTVIENEKGPLILESDRTTKELKSVGAIGMFLKQEGSLWEKAGATQAAKPEMAPIGEFRINVPEELLTQRDELLATYADPEIDETTFELVKGGWEDIRRLDRQIVEVFTKPKEEANKTHKSVIAQEKGARGNLPTVGKSLKKQLEAFQQGRIQQATIENLGEFGDMATVPTGSKGSTEFRQTDRTYRVHNKLELVKAVAAGKLPLDLLDVSDKQMKIQVKAAVESTSIPGVLIEDGGLSLRLSSSAAERFAK